MKNFLKEERTKKGFTQQNLADLVKVSRQTIISIETDRYTPSVLLSIKIAKVLEKKVEDIFELDYKDWK